MLDSDCPSVLSLGRLCAKEGYLFIWEPWYGQPVLFKENGDMILLYCEHFVPFIDDSTVPKDGSGMLANIIERLSLWAYKVNGGTDKESHRHSRTGMSYVAGSSSDAPLPAPADINAEKPHAMREIPVED